MSEKAAGNGVHTPDPENLVEVRNLKEYFPITTGFLKTTMLKAVDVVSFTIRRGETLGLVGESGCGKTTVGRTLLHLYKPTSGEVWFDGVKIGSKESLVDFRKRAQIVFPHDGQRHCGRAHRRPWAVRLQGGAGGAHPGAAG